MKVFSFCLYGTNPKYVRGMHENIKTIFEKFPDFKVFLYYGRGTDISEFSHYNNVIAREGVYTGSQLMLDRFCAIDEKYVEIMFVRDADSRINVRDEWCIRQFIHSKKMFHIIRDHPFHTTPIMGGLWAMKKDCISDFNIRKSINEYIRSHANETGYDQLFLKDVLYPKIISNVLIHGYVRISPDEELIQIPFKNEHMFCGQAIGYTDKGAEYHNCNDCNYLIQMRLLIKLPSRGRPDQLFSIASKYVQYADDMSNTRILIILDTDDSKMTPEYIEKLKHIHPNIEINLGTSTTKIDAINRNTPCTSSFDILLLASDDMNPVQKGYDNVIREKMKQYYPDTDGVLFFNDGFHKNSLNTIAICGSKYYSRFGYIYYPGYKSLWCDNEFTDVANILKKQTYFSEVIIKHEHPGTNSAIVFDETYTRNQVFYFDDEALYFSRRSIIAQMYGPPKTNDGPPKSNDGPSLKMPRSSLNSPIKLPPVSIRIRR